MRRRFFISILGMLLALPAVAEKLPAFPGAEGFGRYTVGGRGGKVYHVTTLKDGTEPGTLRYALMQRGARTVVFEVAGTIHLERPLRIEEDSVTIAGQTAPGQGICIASCPVTVRANEVIIRYLRFRPGNAWPGDHDGLGGSEGRNNIIDHCSISWSVDECCSMYGGENVTVQWCIISESLRQAGHSKGSHGYGGIFGGAGASYHHNLLAHHDSRTPRLGPHVSTQEREHVDMRNNVIYNWAGSGCYGGEGMKVNIVNNYYKPGPATPRDDKVSYRISAINIRTEKYCTNRLGRPNRWMPMKHVWGRFYVDGNVMEGRPDVTRDNWTLGMYAQIDSLGNDGTYTPQVKREMRLTEPLESGVISTQTAEEAYKSVLKGAGCSLYRDEIDRRIVKETRTGTAIHRGSVSKDADQLPGLIDLPTDVMPQGAASPWPDLTKDGAPQRKDSDRDGMPDKWEKRHGLNPNDPTDGAQVTLSKEGYTNLEVFLNGVES